MENYHGKDRQESKKIVPKTLEGCIAVGMEVAQGQTQIWEVDDRDDDECAETDVGCGIELAINSKRRQSKSRFETSPWKVLVALGQVWGLEEGKDGGVP